MSIENAAGLIKTGLGARAKGIFSVCRQQPCSLAELSAWLPQIARVSAQPLEIFEVKNLKSQQFNQQSRFAL